MSDPRAERLGGVLPFLIAWGDCPTRPRIAACGRAAGVHARVPGRQRRASRARALGSGIDVVAGEAPRLVARLGIEDRRVVVLR